MIDHIDDKVKVLELLTKIVLYKCKQDNLNIRNQIYTHKKFIYSNCFNDFYKTYVVLHFMNNKYFEESNIEFKDDIEFLIFLKKLENVVKVF